MDAEAFERLYETHARRLLSFLVYQTGDHSLAEDLVADTFERVLRSRRPFDPRRARETTWLFAIALNLLRDHGRRKNVEGRALQQLSDDITSRAGQTPIEQLDSHDAVVRALGRLTEDERRAVALRYGADLPMADIAALMGQPRKSVEGRIYRSLEKLRNELGAEDRRRS